MILNDSQFNFGRETLAYCRIVQIIELFYNLFISNWIFGCAFCGDIGPYAKKGAPSIKELLPKDSEELPKGTI